jgi:signal peptidase I
MRKEIWSWVKSLALAIILALIIREKVMAFYVVDGNSMRPTLHNGQMVAVNKVVYNFRDPHQGEIVVFYNPAGNLDNRVFIKRVIALPGDYVQIVEGKVRVNGEELDERYIQTITEGDTELIIQAGYIFVLGDNRYPGGSWDSRSFGPILLSEVIGRAEIVIFPLPHRIQ